MCNWRGGPDRIQDYAYSPEEKKVDTSKACPNCSREREDMEMMKEQMRLLWKSMESLTEKVNNADSVLTKY